MSGATPNEPDFGCYGSGLATPDIDRFSPEISPVVEGYEPPFPFTGTISRITFKIHSRADGHDLAAVARTRMSRE